MGFWVGNWLHDPPSKEYDSTGKRAIIKHLCFGPVETQTWYESVDGQYYCELHIIDGLQARDVFLDRISKAKMLEAIITERGRDFRRAEVAETDLNQTKRNQIDFIQPDPSTYPPAPSGRQMGIDRCEVREEVEEVKEYIEYEHLWQELLSLMEQSGYEVKQQRGAISFRAPGQEWFTRLRSSTLGKGYSQKDIEAALSSSQRGTGQPSQRVNLIIDIQSRLQGKGPGYERWAKVFNLKQMAAALAFLQENDLMEYGQLEKKAAEATERFHTLSGQIKSAEAALQTNRVKAATVQYAGTRPVGNRCSVPSSPSCSATRYIRRQTWNCMSSSKARGRQSSMTPPTSPRQTAAISTRGGT